MADRFSRLKVSRRAMLGMVAGTTVCANMKVMAAVPNDLKPITGGVQPIGAEERGLRIAKLQRLMQQQGIAGFLVEAGSSLEYFTGIRWWRSERTTAALIPAEGRSIVVTPFFEEPSVREHLQVPADIRTWKEDESPFELLAAAIRERAAPVGAVAVEGTTRYFIVDQVARASGRQSVLGEELIRACRMIKSPAELALMQTANEVTLAAIRHVHGRVEAGMTGTHIMELLVQATNALGGSHEFSLVLLNEASAFPHGSDKPQTVRNGSVILIDSGCTLHGYQSDISRTWVFGESSARQREVWNTVKRGQEIALETAKIGIPAAAIDKAVRAYYEGRGWSKDYGLPGTSHRTGHGIGVDGHEWPYLVRNDFTALASGMCFSDEPGIYIPGEFGVRLEDCWYMTETGPKLFTPLARSIEQPI
jgi:Xaa-Pro dipeptidase